MSATAMRGRIWHRDFAFTACVGKRGYPSPQAAHHALSQLQRERRRMKAVDFRGKAPIHAYQCPFCHRWHVGRDHIG